MGADEEMVEVAPGIFQSKEDVEANMAYDEMRDEEVSEAMERQAEENAQHSSDDLI